MCSQCLFETLLPAHRKKRGAQLKLIDSELEIFFIRVVEGKDELKCLNKSSELPTLCHSPVD